ncbi:TRAP-type mannitol/chloroaromatic compound transport system, small permease component [Phaeobacter sp. CECT 5382]|uniref:TRAP transporter small permease n=1 Tax=Phaeobacter sp. CECT 5382 TaxID=1712645 RepID=UPI0006DA453C|nr:TRAP transporter small permease subunit [Phaeobacter sp. CECT 5382]CUH88102.1 TRAP-type mannitol/chloroaromatic compound transport system, small permease component [Phaeobacter sp. CECT 5382]
MRDWQPFLGLPLWAWLFVFPTVLALICLAAPEQTGRTLRPLQRLFDRLYLLSGVLASVCMVTILLLIVAQMVARWSSLTFPGSTEYAGYAMAATSFLALAHALTRGAHIRVSIFLNMGHRFGLWLDAFAMWIAAVTATYFARYAIKTNIMSEMLNDRTQGQDFTPEWLLSFFAMFATSPADWGKLWAETGSDWVYTPVWLPQLPMSIGTVLLALALWDYLCRLLITRRASVTSEAVE